MQDLGPHPMYFGDKKPIVGVQPCQWVDQGIECDESLSIDSFGPIDDNVSVIDALILTEFESLTTSEDDEQTSDWEIETAEEASSLDSESFSEHHLTTSSDEKESFSDSEYSDEKNISSYSEFSDALSEISIEPTKKDSSVLTDIIDNYDKVIVVKDSYSKNSIPLQMIALATI